MDAPAAEIRPQNVKDFLRWAFLDTRDPEELDEYVVEIERLLGRKMEPGSGNSQCLRLIFDKVDMWHWSLTWYMVSFYGEIVCGII